MANWKCKENSRIRGSNPIEISWFLIHFKDCFRILPFFGHCSLFLNFFYLRDFLRFKRFWILEGLHFLLKPWKKWPIRGKNGCRKIRCRIVYPSDRHGKILKWNPKPGPKPGNKNSGHETRKKPGPLPISGLPLNWLAKITLTVPILNSIKRILREKFKMQSVCSII